MTDVTTTEAETLPEPENYSQAKERLDEIVRQVRGKDVSLERSLDLLEEGVKLANQCTDLIDQTRWEEAAEEAAGDAAPADAPVDSEPQEA